MAKRDNPYEAAFENFLRARNVPYVAVDEARRTLTPDASLKSLDFIVSSRSGVNLLVDVKGRRFPSGGERPGGQRRYWKNWSKLEDLHSLLEWENVFGEGFRSVFVFAYDVTGAKAPVPNDQMFRCRDAWYGFVAIGRAQYAAHAKPISKSWDTVAMPVGLFQRLAVPLVSLL